MPENQQLGRIEATLIHVKETVDGHTEILRGILEKSGSQETTLAVHAEKIANLENPGRPRNWIQGMVGLLAALGMGMWAWLQRQGQ